jgi:hypothetical protein
MTAYLLGRGLRDLQLLRHALAGGVARPPRRRCQTSLQASRRILGKRDVRKARTAEPRPQLEAVLQRLLVIVFVGCVLHDYGVVSFTDLPPLLGLGLPLLWDLDFLRGAGSETNFFKSSCKTQPISMTTHME